MFLLVSCTTVQKYTKFAVQKFHNFQLQACKRKFNFKFQSVIIRRMKSQLRTNLFVLYNIDITNKKLCEHCKIFQQRNIWFRNAFFTDTYAFHDIFVNNTNQWYDYDAYKENFHNKFRFLTIIKIFSQKLFIWDFEKTALFLYVLSCINYICVTKIQN